ncbi:conserved hypothetical protein [Hyella patelloides LEGE 07179]|uniref:Uncharacterized protein n=1 Tax=Hyella patelloides LEGE 07179 TaxID=945734 RepID=A0A563W298_9CYAN|nr:hypothetical protein [Hyella patelloides]VEP17808.1 conserved hypothetical protein [Hyella patelloides LEGE 07179]
MSENQKWNLKNEGREWSREEVEEKYFKLCPEKIELIEGKLFWNDEERLAMLAMLLENVGADKAVRLGDKEVWKAAIAKLEEQ